MPKKIIMDLDDNTYRRLALFFMKEQQVDGRIISNTELRNFDKYKIVSEHFSTGTKWYTIRKFDA